MINTGQVLVHILAVRGLVAHPFSLICSFQHSVLSVALKLQIADQKKDELLDRP